jgi:hypothetical protein
MYEVRDYLTDELIALCSRKTDAVAMTTGTRRPEDPVLIYEEKKV